MEQRLLESVDGRDAPTFVQQELHPSVSDTQLHYFKQHSQHFTAFHMEERI